MKMVLEWIMDLVLKAICWVTERVKKSWIRNEEKRRRTLQEVSRTVLSSESHSQMANACRLANYQQVRKYYDELCEAVSDYIVDASDPSPSRREATEALINHYKDFSLYSNSIDRLSWWELQTMLAAYDELRAHTRDMVFYDYKKLNGVRDRNNNCIIDFWIEKYGPLQSA